MNFREIILASRSPRRIKILSKLCADFKIVPPDIDEVIDHSFCVELAILDLARQKASRVLSAHKSALVIGADTAVVFDGKILGKPKDEKNAREMLEKLSGKTHSVITAVCAATYDYHKSGYCVSEVTFNNLSQETIENYIKSGACMDKAGAYGIQDGAKLVKTFRGSYTNIVGLPVRLTAKLIR